MHSERLTLATLCGGAVQEKVDRALEKVANNILDPNTDPSKKRSITLKITLKPDEDDKEDVEVSADVSVSLAPEIGVSTRFFVNKDLENGKVAVMEHKKGEIRGQLDFSDFGIKPGKIEGDRNPFDTEEKDSSEDAKEDSETYTMEDKVIDFRSIKAN